MRDRLSAQPRARARGPYRHPADHRPPGADRPAHGGRDLARHQRAQMGVFCMQHGPGTENAYGGVAQAYARIGAGAGPAAGLCAPPGLGAPNYNARLQMRGITKSAEPLTSAGEIRQRHAPRLHPAAQRPGGPVLVEIPVDVWNEEIEALDYTPARPLAPRPDPEAVREAAAMLVAGQAAGDLRRPGRPLGRGLGRAARLAELLAIPVCTSLAGKSAFDETHPLALGSGGAAMPRTRAALPRRGRPDLRHRLQLLRDRRSACRCRRARRVIHATLDPMDIDKDRACELALLGDAKLTLAALLDEAVKRAGAEPRDPLGGRARDPAVEAEWLERWLPKLESDETPLDPYRVLWDLQQTVDVANTIITHDAGSPRDQLVAVLEDARRRSATSAGARSTQLGYGLGLAMGAKLACPTSCASTSGAMPRSASPAWISRPRCASASRSSRSCSTISAMAIELDGHAGRDREVPLDRHLRRLCRFRPRARRLWRAGRPSRTRSCPRSGAASRRPSAASRRWSSSSPPRRSRSLAAGLRPTSASIA